MPLGTCHIGPRAIPAHGDPRRLAANRQRGAGRHRAKIDDGQIVARLIRNEGLVGVGRADEQRREKCDRESAKTHSRSTRAFSAARPLLNSSETALIAISSVYCSGGLPPGKAR